MARLRIVAVVVLCLGISVGAEATSILLEPGAKTVSPGEAVPLDLVVSGLGPAVLGDYDLDISFDPAVLTLDSFTVSGALGSAAAGEVLDFSLGLTPGLLNLSIVSLLSAAELDALQGASFSLAALSFTVGSLAPGASTLVEIIVHAVGDGSGAALLVDSLQNTTLTAPGGTGSAPVPEPATLILCLIGLAAWLCSSAVRRKAATTS